jgi:RHS repeat-associated protein
MPESTMTYDADNRIAGWNGNTVDHDTNGNMTFGPLPDGNMSIYTYDAYDRLASAGGVQSRYNPEGLRVEADGATYVVNPNSGLSQVMVREKGATTTRYVWGLGLIYEDEGGEIKTYHSDQLGSTIAMADGTGAVTDRWEYTSYGTVSYQGTADTPFLFHGGLGCMTDSNGLVYMRARFYNPRIMRFLNADPIRFDGGMNWYAFVGNNPLLRIDPEGLNYAEELILLHNRHEQDQKLFKYISELALLDVSREELLKLETKLFKRITAERDASSIHNPIILSRHDMQIILTGFVDTMNQHSPENSTNLGASLMGADYNLLRHEATHGGKFKIEGLDPIYHGHSINYLGQGITRSRAGQSESQARALLPLTVVGNKSTNMAINTGKMLKGKSSLSDIVVNFTDIPDAKAWSWAGYIYMEKLKLNSTLVQRYTKGQNSEYSKKRRF